MATVRAGRKGALVVVDVQVGVVDSAWTPSGGRQHRPRGGTGPRGRGSRGLGEHQDDELAPDSPSWQWVRELVPADGETRVHKEYNSSFEKTSLDDELGRLGVSHLALAGAATNWCIRATAYAALERGYDVTLVEDAHTTDGEAAETVVDDLNTVMRWVSYADVSNTAVPAGELDFASLA